MSENAVTPESVAAETARHWTLAALVVVSGASLGTSIGAEFGHPLLGVVVGVIGGLATNYARGCQPCRRHAEIMRRAMQSAAASQPPPPPCSACERARQQRLQS